MDQYVKAFLEIYRSAQQLQAGKLHSNEIKHSAASLEKSLQSCFAEVHSFAARLEELMKSCLEELETANDMWCSKQRIIDVPESHIYEQFAILAGYQVKINELVTSCKLKTINKISTSWNDNFEMLKQEIFFDKSKNKIKEDIGWSDKDLFIKEFTVLIEKCSKNLDEEIKENIEHIYYVSESIPRQEMLTLIALLDKNKKINLTKNLYKFIDLVRCELKKPLDNLKNRYTIKLSSLFKSDIENWKKRFANITWEEVSGINKKIPERIERRVNFILDDRLAAPSERINEIISFYKSFIELQSSYKKESIEHKLSEKAWIEQQQQKIQQLQSQINNTLDRIS
jgi:hypothetical protein